MRTKKTVKLLAPQGGVCTDGLGAGVEFIKAKLAKAEMTLAKREAMEKCWLEGTDESWRAAGCYMSKSDRLETSARHGRIAVKNREEVAMFKAVLHQLAPNAKADRGPDDVSGTVLLEVKSERPRSPIRADSGR
jgi:hypothetical protein